MNGIVSPATLVRGAHAAGFTISYRHLNYARGQVRAIILTHGAGPGIVEAGKELLRQVARTPDAKGNGLSSFNSFHQVGNQEFCDTSIMVEDVVPDYLDTVFHLATLGNEQMLLAALADQEFNAKVEQEIEEDPEMLAQKARVTEAQAVLTAEMEASDRLRDRLREEREGLRKPYQYVTNEREI